MRCNPPTPPNIHSTLPPTRRWTGWSRPMCAKCRRPSATTASGPTTSRWVGASLRVCSSVCVFKCMCVCARVCVVACAGRGMAHVNGAPGCQCDDTTAGGRVNMGRGRRGSARSRKARIRVAPGIQPFRTSLLSLRRSLAPVLRALPATATATWAVRRWTRCVGAQGRQQQQQ